MTSQHLVVLAGGVGGARFLRGLVAAVPQAEITVIGNTADDIDIHGLHVSPDLDTVTYTLSGLADEGRGWGLADESWRTLRRLERLGEDTWFQLGDLDLATHLFRAGRLARGDSISQVTSALATRLGLPVRLLPMSDQRVTTRVHTADGRDLHLQEYLVREGCRPEVRSLEYRGAAAAGPAPGVLPALRSADLLILAPSNPFISIGPILAVPGLGDAVRASGRVVAVSPIVQGRAVKGPAAAMLRAAGLPVSALGVAMHYRGLIQALVFDDRDRELAPEVEALGIAAHPCDTLMVDGAARRNLALAVLRAGAAAVA